MSVNLNNDFRYVTQEANDPEAEKFLKKRLCWTPIRCDRSYFFSVFREQVVQ